MKNVYIIFRITLLFLIFLQPVFLISQTNQCLHCDGQNDYVRLDDGSQYIVNSPEGMTLVGWFNIDDNGGSRGLIGYRGSNAGGFWMSQNPNGTIKCRFVGTDGFFEYIAPANTMIPSLWVHLAWVYDGSSELRLYVDGVMQGSVAASGTITNPNVPFTLGRSILGSYNFYFKGKMDEASVWNKALTQDEIQDMMENELTGNEDNLQLYYKFNQGEPGGDNTSITHLISETGSGERDGELLNFALIGETSNFIGELDPGFQAISFPQIPNHLTTDDPFELEATATSGLEVLFQVISGPAEVDGNILTLTGVAGEVVVEATQPGDDTYDPADPVQNTFMVIDPIAHTPEIDIRNPLAGDVLVPELGYIQLAALATIEYPELFWVQNVAFEIDGESFTPTNWDDGYYTGWWPVPEYGDYQLTITATNNYGASSTQVVNINVISDAEDMEIQAAEDILLDVDHQYEIVEVELPSYLGAFDQIIGTLELTCPPNGCDPWDMGANVFARGHDGRWFEIIRYITPYGVPCSHTIDLTDYMSLLQGKISLKFSLSTIGTGFLFSLKLNYSEGAPEHNYSYISNIWQDHYPFGDYANLQPVSDTNYTFPENTEAATMKLVSTGHGWGNNNTGNAAEFYEATHHIWVNGEETFEQHNWYTCNPNPDGCQPQNGTWYYDRAGWCPGTIAQWYDFDLTPYVDDVINLDYVFYENYVDYCHANHPDCVTGVTCSDCNDGYNPVLVVACNLVSFGDMPLDGGTFVSIDENQNTGSYIELFPNPSNGIMELSFNGEASFEKANISVTNISGIVIDQFDWYGETTTLNLTNLSKGFYFINIKINNFTEVRKIVIQ